MQINLLTDVGRTDDAQQQAASLGNMIPKSGADASQPMSSQIRFLYALASLANGDNMQMEQLIREESRLVSESSVRAVMDQAPLAVGPNIQLDLLPAAQGYTAYQALYQSPNRWANHEFMLAQSELSTWHNDLAEKRLKAILEAEPNVSLRPLICFYLEMLTGEPQQIASPEQQAAAAKAAAAAAQPAAPTTPTTGEPAVTPPVEAPVDPAATPAPVNPPATPEPPSTPAVETPAAPPEAVPAAEQKPE